MSYTIVAVIGHIDHGKTSLVAALTGVDTDTHPEEKRRGITIDLGFASYTDGEHQFALIDAPGHQKYIGNLLAGVSSVDVGLLVVACDQGIQAQTLEHAAILESLGVSQLIVAMSRIDLADAKTRQELSEELDVFLADYGFHEIPKVAVSSLTGEGLDQLRSLLRRIARTTDRVAIGNFRMPIDRVFTIEGRGCVVAGTPWSGSVAVGDHLQLSRSGQIVRVRGLEVHGQSVETSQAGFRTAVNLVGASSAEIERGDELVAENSHRPTRRMVAQMKMFQETSELRCPATVQMHTATAACSARIIGVKRLLPGEEAIVVIDTDQPIVATYQQQYLFRRPYPVGSFAGGRILASVDPSDRKTATLLELGRALRSSDAAGRLAAWADFRGELTVDPSWAESQLGVTPEMLQPLIEQCAREGRATSIDGRLVSQPTIDRVTVYIIKVLTQHAEAGDDAWMDEESLIRRIRSAGSPAVGRHALEDLLREGKLVRVNRMVSIASEQTVLSKKQRAKMEQILDVFQGSRTPPTIKELANQLEISVDAANSLVRFATQQRILVDLGNGFFLAHDVWMAFLGELKEMFERSSDLSVSEIRDGWKVTRKYAIPMLEYCDRMELTTRHQDMRSAGRALAQILEPQELKMDGDVKEQTVE